MKESIHVAFIGFGIGILIILGLYFFWHVPEVEKSYKKGLAECYDGIDTVYIPGKDSIEYRDTTIYVIRPVKVEEKDSSVTLTTENDTAFISGKDLIAVKSSVNIDIKREEGKWKFSDVEAKWVEEIKHQDNTPTPDTVKINVPVYVFKTEYETNWLITGIAYVAGIVTTIAIYLTSK